MRREEISLLSLCFREPVLAHEAERTFKVIVNFRPGGAGGDALLGTAQRFIVFPSADVAYIFHRGFLLGLFGVLLFVALL
jgi:hypothetical protein